MLDWKYTKAFLSPCNFPVYSSETFSDIMQKASYDAGSSRICQYYAQKSEHAKWMFPLNPDSFVSILGISYVLGFVAMLTGRKSIVILNGNGEFLDSNKVVHVTLLEHLKFYTSWDPN